MSATYNYGANPQIDYPRLLIADTDVSKPIFQDSEILAMYTINAYSFVVYPPISQGWGFNPAQQGINFAQTSYRFVAASLLEALASNKARLASALKSLDVSVDTTKAATALMDVAKALRAAEQNSGAFGIAEMVNDDFSARERVWKQMLRLYAV